MNTADHSMNETNFIPGTGVFACSEDIEVYPLRPSTQFLFFGWGCLIWQPLALQYGKRPVYLFSMLATMVRKTWSHEYGLVVLNSPRLS